MENNWTALFPEALCRVLSDFMVESAAGVQAVSGTFAFPADSEVFAGHFPGEPILPAVVQLTLVRLLAVRALQRKLVPAGVGRIKFNRIVKPAEPVQVAVKLELQQTFWTAAFCIKRLAETVASGTILFSEA